MNETIRITVNTKDVMSITLLENLQGSLKTLTDENYSKLKAEILRDGFSFVVHAYEDIESGKIYIVDGHQRVEALRRMRDEEGYTIPQIPIVFVQADDINHAKRKVLAAASQYGTFSQVGAEKFISSIDGVSLDFLQKQISMPFVNFEMMSIDFGDPIIVSQHFRERTDANKEWDGMPEYNQEDKMPFRTIYVHFENQDDIEKFSKLIGQEFTDKTKSIWYPEQVRNETESKRYVLRKNE